MILSHKHRFIFIKTTKTAGTSVEIALSKFCGPEDIIAAISPEDEVTRKELGYPGPQHHTAPLRHYSFQDWKSRLRRGVKPRWFYNHMPASLIRDRAPAEAWKTYYKFAIERNPWDRAVSLFYWHRRNKPDLSFETFMEDERYLGLRKSGFGLYSIDGKVVADRICRFETLEQDLEEVRQELGLPEPLVLPRAKGGFRAKKQHYRELMTPAYRDRIAEAFAWEIETFGYEF